jgi:cytochrome c peroxidase
MKVPSNPVSMPTLPTDGNARRPLAHTLRRVAILAVVLACAVVAAGAYGVTHPDKLPAKWGDVVQDWTGINAHPVTLLLPPVAPLSAVALLGQKMFNDPALSASGQQSCASCHSAAHAYGPPNDLSVQMGGPHMTLHGYRPPPSLAYLYRQATFSIGPDLGGDVEVPIDLNALADAAKGTQRATKDAGTTPATAALVPQGGLFWDGRADSLQRQALGPMLNPVEMANANVADVAAKLKRAPYAAAFSQLFGDNVLRQDDLLVSEAMFAIGRYEYEDPSFHAFSSKYDAWLQGKARLTQAEMHGMALFNDPTKANCAGCHLSQPTKDGLPPLFTDTQYEALGVPRNRSLELNKDPTFFDLGVCGPFRKDVASQTQYCGMFLTPTLRNVDTRHVFFHNGEYHTLQDVMNFYNLRSTNPEKIYPKDAAGKVEQYDDIPAKYHANVDVADPPFDRKPGEAPAMTQQDIKDIIAFIGTLDDGYTGNPK